MGNRALVIGIGNYQNGIRSLPGVKGDVNAIAGLLRSNDGAFNSGDVCTVLDRDGDAAALRRSLKDCFLDSAEEDTVFLYIAGHGAIENEEFFFLAYDTKPSHLGDTAIALREIKKLFDQTSSNRVLVWLDFCYSGAIVSRDHEGESPEMVRAIVERTLRIDQGHGKIIMCACAADQRAYETAEHGLFTRFLVEGLKGAARNAAGEVTASSLHDYVDKKMGSAKQRPLFSGEMSGRIVLMHTPESQPALPAHERPWRLADIFRRSHRRSIVDIAVCLETNRVSFCVAGTGTFVTERCVAAIKTGTDEVVAAGNEAKQILETTLEGVVAVRPIKDGVISDIAAAEALLRHCFRKMLTKRATFRVMATVPSGASEVEKRALREAVKNAGARDVGLIENSLAAAIGVGVQVQQRACNGLIHCGWEIAEVALISLSQMVFCRRVHVAGEEFNEAIIQYMKRAYSVLIGTSMAEDIKRKIGSVYPMDKEDSLNIRARDGTGRLTALTISSQEIREVLLEPISTIVDSVRIALERCPPELSSDLADSGFVLAGDEVLPGMDRLITEETGFPARVADNAGDALIQGAEKAFTVLPFKSETVQKRP